MKPVIIGDATLHHGDCIEVMRTLAESSVDSVVCDPPYGLEFMGKEWDGADGFRRSLNKADAGRDSAFGRTSRTSPEYRAGHLFQEWCEVWAHEALRVLKPGGHLLAFSGSRTYHRMTCAIEDAGFEVRDQIMWVYGSGFPKSHNGPWGGTALKPAHEPICVARKPLIGTVAANFAQFGTGALNIDGCRVAYEDTANPATNPLYRAQHGYAGTGSDAGSSSFKMKPGGADAAAHDAGRWPANIIHDGSGEVVALFPESKSGGYPPEGGQRSQVSTYGKPTVRGDQKFTASEGSASRFFYCAKASRTDRNDGLASNDTPAVDTDATMRDCETADWSTRNGNHHPTVKPTDLMAYLCRLVTPPGGTVLDPFMGSGSTGKASMREGFRFIGIDMTPEYIEIAKARITHEHSRVTEAAALAAIPPPQLDLFDKTPETA